RPEVPAEIDALIQRACEKDRALRFASCEEMLAVLDAATPPSVGAPFPLSGLPPPVASGRAPISKTVVEEPAAGPSGGVTGTGTELPIRRARRSGAWIAVPLALVVLGGAAAGALAMGLVEPPWQPHKRTHHPHHAATGPVTPASAPSPKSPLEALVGPWVGNGRDLDAVLDGDVLEFRVHTPSQFAPQDYQAGEARFALRATSDPNVFAVEDRIRPIPPPGRTYDPRSRGTCQEIWTHVGGEPLRARWDGTRLSVDFAKIEPTVDNFVPREGKTITSCVGLNGLKQVRVVSQLVRGS
ncbi:MAG TPA: serine/threonine protein kinase, partial [Minicystis sp.]|nr:serine/threonine protein kinase [Minicystis sp.]